MSDSSAAQPPAAATARELHIRVRQQEPLEEHSLTVPSDVRHPFPLACTGTKNKIKTD